MTGEEIFLCAMGFLIGGLAMVGYRLLDLPLALGF
jgi:hypothetical protein